MLNNKATQAKLESINYLTTQTKQCEVTKTKLATLGSYFLCYTSKKATSKLLKLN